MRLGLNNLGLTGASNRFSPLSAFAGSGAGAWYDPSDLSSMFQDSAGTTPVTASTQPVGKILDKSGRSNHASQTVAGSRPLETISGSIYSNTLDGSDDGYNTGAITLTSNMDCFIALKRSSAAQGVAVSQVPGDVSKFFAVMQAGAVSIGSTAAGAGPAWTCFVNGVEVGSGAGTASRDGLNTAIPTGIYKIVEFRNLDLSAWTQLTIGSYPSFMLAGDIGGFILCPAQSTGTRNNIRTWLGAKVGLNL